MAKASFEIAFRPGAPPAERKYPGFGYRVSRHEGILIERDVAVPMRDGAKIYADVFRPEGGDRVPALVAWTPYGKHAPLMYDRFYKSGGVKKEWYSEYTIFEGPDPLYWGSHGYAVVNVDLRGLWHSEGVTTYWCHDEARDIYDLIEWLAAQPWCSGKVGMTGVSYLTTVQWLVAALRPPHLAAINPWEGFNDMYREFAFHGGIPETHFIPMWQQSVSFSLTKVEDVAEMVRRHPLFDDYWATKTPDLSRIEVPAYVVASWTDQGLHTRGTLEGFRQMSSKQKWLEIHGRKKWEHYHRPESVAKQRAFFDHFLKGVDNGVPRWPRVRLEVRERYYVGKERAENEWPLARTQYRKLFLDARRGTLVQAPAKVRAKARYEAPGDRMRAPAAYRAERAQFDYVFPEATELTGYMKLHLWVEAVGADDMDLFVALQKLDRAGNYVPLAGFSTMEDGPVALGWLRVSHRELDEQRSTPWQPWLLHRRERKLKPGVPVPVEIEIWPSGTRFAAGERLRLVVQGSDIYEYDASVRIAAHRETRNAGLHVIHTGGKHDSHLLVPVVPGKRV